MSTIYITTIFFYFIFFAFDSFIYQTKAFLNQKIFDIINQINPDYLIVFKGFFRMTLHVLSIQHHDTYLKAKCEDTQGRTRYEWRQYESIVFPLSSSEVTHLACQPQQPSFDSLIGQWWDQYEIRPPSQVPREFNFIVFFLDKKKLSALLLLAFKLMINEFKFRIN